MNISALKELVASEGWKILEGELTQRARVCLEQLARERSIDKITYYQAQIQEVRFLVKYPHVLIQEEKLSNSGGTNETGT